MTTYYLHSAMVSRGRDRITPQWTAVVRPRLTLRGHTHQVRSVVHLPGGRIVTCSDDGSLRLWDLESGTQIGDDWQDKGTLGIVFSIALSPNGKTIASGSVDGIVRLWDVEKGKVIAKWTGHTLRVCSVCWSGDGERVASASSDGMLRVWDAENGKTLLGPIKTGHSWVYGVSYSPDNSKIATGGVYEGGVRIWNSKTGKLLFKECDTANTRIVLQETVCTRGLAWVSDGKKLVATSSSSTVIWKTTTWKPIAILRGSFRDVQAISLSPNNHILASAPDDCTVCLWNLGTNRQIGLPLLHESDVQCIALSGDGKALVTACIDGNVYVWDMCAILKEAGLDSGLLSIPDSLGIYHRFSAHRRLRLGAITPTVLFSRLSSLFRPSQTISSEATELHKQSQGEVQASSLHT